MRLHPPFSLAAGSGGGGGNRPSGPARPGGWLIAIGVMLLVALAACGRTSPSPEVESAPVQAQNNPLQVRTLEAIGAAIDRHYLYSERLDESWQVSLERHLASSEEGLGDQAFTQAVDDLLSGLPEGEVIWQTRKERISQELEDTAAYEGIGAFVTFRAQPEPHIVLLAIIPESPAQVAGLLPHESVYAIDGEPITEAEGLGAVERIRGPAGSQAILTVGSPDGSRREVSITRASLAARESLKVGLNEATGIGYMLFPPSSYPELGQDVLAGLQSLTEDGQVPLKGLILDLRIASSGVDWPLEALLRVFGDGDAGEFYTRQDTETLTIQGEDLFGSQNVPLVILVGPDTRGHPEILAGALQTLERATVIGLPTPGMVEQMEEIALPDGSRLFVVSGSFRNIQGRDIGEAGLEPAERIELDWDQVSTDRDATIAVAIGILQAGEG